MKNTIAIVMINYNGSRNTRDCLRSIAKADLKDIELNVIIIDNGSEKFSYEASEFKNFTIEVLRPESNLGFSAGNNMGMRRGLAKGAAYIMLLNNDTIVSKTFFQDILQVAKDDKAEIYVPKIYFAAGFEYHKKRYKKDELGKVIWYAGGYIDWKNIIGVHRGVDEVDRGQFDVAEKTELATGCCMLIKREVLEKVGFLDERYFLYYEDSDYSMRVKQAGFSILYVPRAYLWHKNASSSGGSGSALQDYYISRNRMLFGMSYAPFQTKISLFRESIRLLINGRKWQKIGIIDYCSRRFGRGKYKF